MNILIFLFIIIVILIYYNYQNILTTINFNPNYTLGILVNNEDFYLVADMLKKFSNEPIKIVFFKSEIDLLYALNNNKINFSINLEDTITDAINNLNSYTNENESFNNLNLVTGLYFNYLYFISNNTKITDEDNKDEIENILNVEDIFKFYNNCKRNYILGTEEINSTSFMSMMMILYLYGFNPIPLHEYDKSKTYSNNDIFYYASDLNDVISKFNNDILDGIFLVRTNNNKYIKNIINQKDVIFLNISLKDTIFDDIFSLNYNKKLINLNEYYSNFSIQYNFETRKSRVVLVTNKDTDTQVVNSLLNTYYNYNNVIINTLTQKNLDNLNSEHNFFEPLDIAFVNKYLSMHKASLKFFKENNFIFDENKKKKLELNNNDKFKHYWKFDKIGLINFD